MGFGLGATAGAEADWAKAGTRHEFVEEVLAGRLKKVKGFGGFGGIVRLHENEGHAAAGPVGFEENRKFGAVAGETGVAGDSKFEVGEATGEVGVQAEAGIAVRRCWRAKDRRGPARLSK